jgi:hypothetical protein
MIFEGMMVQTEVTLREDPWAEAGTVVKMHRIPGVPGTDGAVAEIAWPGVSEHGFEMAWTLRQVFPGNRAPNPDAADLAADRAGL